MAYQKMPDFMGQPANAVRRLSDDSVIPMADDSADYARYLEWVAAGNEPADVDAPDAETVRAGMRLSFAQLLIGLVAEKWITDAEGEAWLEAKLPAALQAVIATLPQEHQFPARARALRPSQIERLDPMVDMLGAAQDVTPEKMDEFFVRYMAV